MSIFRYLIRLKPTAGYLSCRCCFLSRRLIHQIEDAVIGDAGVLAEPHFTGAAIAESLTAIPGHLGGQAGECGGVEPGSSALVAGKAAALDMLRDYHLRAQARATASMVSPAPYAGCCK